MTAEYIARYKLVAQFSNGHILNKTTPYTGITHAYWLHWEANDDQSGDLYGFASNYAAAERAAKNVLTRLAKKHNLIIGNRCVEIVSSACEIKRRSPQSRFLKVLWKPKGMADDWDKGLAFGRRFLVVGTNKLYWRTQILGQEYKVSKKTGEILVKDAKGKYVTGGPIFAEASDERS